MTFGLMWERSGFGGGWEAGVRSCGVTGIGNADAEMGISTAMTTTRIAPTPSVFVERRLKALVNGRNIMGSEFQWWCIGNRWDRKEVTIRCAPALSGIGGRLLHRYGQRDASMDSGW